MSEREHRVELDQGPVECLALVEREASSWGGRWQAEGRHGGRLRLPVLAGLRQGWVEGPLTVEPLEAGSRLTFRVERSDYQVQRTSVAFLLLAACGGLIFLVAPFVPALWPALPLGLLLSFGAWFLIVSGLRNSGPEEFFETLEGGPSSVAAQRLRDERQP